MKNVITISILLLLSTLSIAQKTQNKEFAMQSFVKKDSILLRWAPMSSDLLKKGLKYGYILERISANGTSIKNTIPPFNKTTNSNNIQNKEYTELIDNYISSSTLNKSEDDYTFGILLLASSTNKELSHLLNLYFIDTQIEKNNEYKYKLQLNYKSKEAIELKVNSNNISQQKKLSKLSASADNKRKTVYLKWEAESLQSDYSSYWIERSEDSIKFQRLNNTPYIFFKSSDEINKTHIDYLDQTVKEGKTYWYKITGINHFAENGSQSNIEKVTLKHTLKGTVKIDTIYANKSERIIQGKFEPTIASDIKHLKSFILFKSDSMHSGSVKIAELLPKTNTFNFIVNSEIESGDRNYYKVGAISIDNDTIFSFTRYFFTLDQIPPSQPQNLLGSIDSNGIVSLEWKLNPENDIRGYRVFRSNSLKEEFVETTKTFADSNIFYDTIPLNNLTSSIYYRVAAVDLNYNNSIHSKEIKLIKPDTISPVACLFTSYKSNSNGMTLKWINSSSEDVKTNQLLSKNINGHHNLLAKWSDTLSNFIDTSAVLGEQTTYTIKTIDYSNNISLSKEITVVYETGKRPSVSNLKARVNTENKHIVLEWDKPRNKVFSYKIYKSKNNSPYSLFKTIRNQISYTDNSLSINNTYSYKVVVVYQSGIKSEYSTPVIVNF